MTALSRSLIVARAYVRMAAEANYRPAALSDGMGITIETSSQDDLTGEAADYAAEWLRLDEGRELATAVGVPCYEHLTAFVFMVEAARCTCGMASEPAAKLLAMARAELLDAGVLL